MLQSPSPQLLSSPNKILEDKMEIRLPLTDHYIVMNNLAPLTMFITACLLIFTSIQDWLFQYETTAKMVTTYGSFVVFWIATTVQGVRWWRKWLKVRRDKLTANKRNRLK